MGIDLRIFDNAFEGAHSASLGGENLDIKPTTIRWLREGPPTDPTIFTDARIGMAPDIPGRKIAWILEPYDLHPGPYEDAIRLEQHFDRILTHDRYFADREGWELYRYGGSWIHSSEWGLHPKTKNISIIASQKNSTVGHRLRRKIADNLMDPGLGFSKVKSISRIHPLDVFGHGYKEIRSKTTALKPYRYSVVVESSRKNDYFSEKLIDCICMGTIPIYWGCEAVDDIFDPDGIIRFRSIKELEKTIDTINVEAASEVDYGIRIDAVRRNIKIAESYRICEDHMIGVLS